MEILFIIIIVIAVITANVARAKKQSDDAARTQTPPPTQNRARPYTPTARQYPTQQRATNSIYRQNAHIDANKNYAVDSVNAQDTIDSYSMQQLGYSRSSKQPTREEMLKRREELTSLLDAGIIDHEEYEQKLHSPY